jgi:hypothetical protein
LLDEVDHERWVDDPDAGGEVRAPIVDERVAAVASAVTYLAGDPQLERPGLGARTESVELTVEPLGLAAEDRGDLPLAGLGQMGAGLVDLLGSVEQGAVVDPAPATTSESAATARLAGRCKRRSSGAGRVS